MTIPENSSDTPGNSSDAEGPTPAKRSNLQMLDPPLFEDGKKKLSLLTSTYPLNKSYSKQIMVGFRYDATDGSFLPMVQITNSCLTSSVFMYGNTWRRLQNHFDQISYYFNSRPDDFPATIQVNEIDVIFKKFCGVKSVMFVSRDENCVSEKNKRKRDSASIIMHKKTFDGLLKATVCADECFHRLERMVFYINKFKKHVMELLNNYVNKQDLQRKDFDNHIQESLLKNIEHFKEFITTVFVDRYESAFVVNYFHRVFKELVFYSEILAYEIKCVFSQRENNVDVVSSQMYV